MPSSKHALIVEILSVSSVSGVVIPAMGQQPNATSEICMPVWARGRYRMEWDNNWVSAWSSSLRSIRLNLNNLEEGVKRRLFALSATTLETRSYGNKLRIKRGIFFE